MGTAVDLSDKDKEETGAEISLGSLSRYDLSLEECTESSLQAMLQLTTYLTIQMRPPDVFSTYYVDSNFQYQAILVSCIFSTLSLTMGRVKANKLNTENLASIPKQIGYFLAALASTISSQLLMTVFAVCCIDVVMVNIWTGMNFAMEPILVCSLFMLPGSLILTRKFFLVPKLRTRTDLLTRKGTNILSFLFPVQALHLPASKTKIPLWCTTVYPGDDTVLSDVFLKENI